MRKPVVFISSTCEDLKTTGYRAAAREAALGAGLFPEMQEYWPAKDNPPLDECLARVAQADVLVVVVAYRFGWVPNDQLEKDPKKHKSITWLECEQAKNDGKDVLAFLVDEDYQWPQELCEDHELVSAIRENRLTPELPAEIQWRVNQLKEFKTWLSGTRNRLTFTTPIDLRGKIESSLLKWCHENQVTEEPPKPKSDPGRYLRLLRQETSHIDIRGLQVESGKAQRFPIDELYIPLKTTPSGGEQPSRGGRTDRKADQLATQERAPIELHRALENRTLVILGDPGAGKTTFLARIAYGLCNSRLGLDAATTAETLGLDQQPFPMLVRISELVDHVEGCCGKGESQPHTKASSAWLAHFLAKTSAEGGTDLDADFFKQELEDGSAMVLLDGLDETPTRQQREDVADLVVQAARRFADCRFVVTSRPPAFEGKAVLPDFTTVWIDPLEDAAIQGFLTRWCRALFAGSERQAQQHCDELLKALGSRPEIRRMARNPVMLTALAVVHWHEKRLPEQRADLYESIITWLSRSREKRSGRLPAEVCINRLQELALAMQNHPEGRQVQVPRHWAAERIAPEWPQRPGQYERLRIQTAETFLAEEELDSGIVVRRGDDIRFWHLTFQEFLAARAIAARADQEQDPILLAPPDHPSLYLPSWREVVLLLAGVLYKQGRRKVDAFVSTVLEAIRGDGTLADQARCAGLLGAVVRDLAAVGYQPIDARYQQLMDRVMAIFDAGRSEGIDIKVVIEAGEALGQAGDPRFTEAAAKDNWITIPAGEFLMGAQKDHPDQPNFDPAAYDDESPVHRVSLDAFRIGRYPVTVGEYLRFTEAGGYQDETLWSEGGFGRWPAPEGWEEQADYRNRPVTGLSWFEAAAYAAWMNCRLPTEAEWERAARGPDGHRYPWGDVEPDSSRMNYADSGIGHPTPVGVYPRGATVEQIQDMAGNVWEWCGDWWRDNYAHNAADSNPKGPSSGSARVLRGGSWVSFAGNCRSTYRFSFVPDVRNDYIGFRLVSSSGLALSQ